MRRNSRPCRSGSSTVRRDLTCTLDASWSLHQALPDSELVIVKEGGHLAGESVMVDALVTATDEMAKRLR